MICGPVLLGGGDGVWTRVGGGERYKAESVVDSWCDSEV